MQNVVTSLKILCALSIYSSFPPLCCLKLDVIAGIPSGAMRRGNPRKSRGKTWKQPESEVLETACQLFIVPHWTSLGKKK